MGIKLTIGKDYDRRLINADSRNGFSYFKNAAGILTHNYAGDDHFSISMTIIFKLDITMLIVFTLEYCGLS